MPRRRTQQREVRLVAEYLAQEIFPHPYKQNAALGPAQPGLAEALGDEKGLAASRPWRFAVDAIAFPPGELVLIEGKILKLADGIAKLPLYRALVDETPELAPYRGLPVVMRLVCPWESEQAQRLARAAGVEIVMFCPEWIKRYVDELHDYWTADNRRERAERLRLRQDLGVD